MLFKGREYYLAAILIIVISIFLFMWSFEKRKPKTREVVVLAVMTINWISFGKAWGMTVFTMSFKMC